MPPRAKPAPQSHKSLLNRNRGYVSQHPGFENQQRNFPTRHTMSEPPEADAPAAEDAAKVVDADAADQRDNNAMIEAYVAEMSAKLRAKAELRTSNLTCVRPSDEYFSRLDSSLKRNTAFVKKIKQFTATHLDALLKDMAALNLTKYISEISAALVEAKLKMTDVNAAITLCCRLHCVYSDFSHAFFENWQKVLTIKPTEAIANPSKLRVDLRLFAELIAVGIFSNKSGLPLLGTVLTNLISQDKEDHSNLSIILSFCRHCGEEYAGLVPSSILIASKSSSSDVVKQPLPMSTLLAPDKQQNLRNLLRDYFHSLCKYLRSEHKALQSEHRVSRKLMETKGEVSTDRREKLELMQGNYDKLMTSIQTMADLLNEPMPDLPRDEEADKSGIVLDMIGERGFYIPIYLFRNCHIFYLLQFVNLYLFILNIFYFFLLYFLYVFKRGKQ